ncbi:EcaB [Desulfamplus magnetovallimortis]|uniref:carbonic anhydrase n=1 Tax=Desulfamplus magnetovallimortis TaxID=1246637 RepID=A0A1W1H632_9BACT|nr:carbonic anhydrase [Desulfamplus magnetovallimortis]SLM27917.1 EcaB [Desulfamplus magnetovallimortis]
MSNKTNQIIFAGYIILMVIVAAIFNSQSTTHSDGEAVTSHAETVVSAEQHATDTAEQPVADHSPSSKTQTADASHEQDPTPSDDPAAHKEAVEPDADTAKQNEKLAMLSQALKKIAEIDNRKPIISEQEGNPFAGKPSPDLAIAKLQQGNDRFVNGEAIHPNLDAARLKLAAIENQGDHAYATVITCSDSRVPVEALFDAGIMDIFVIRVAGNVCDVDERGSIEYGLAHVHTPVLVVLGHTQCGAVTAVTHAVQGHGHPLERNIPDLVANIEPAVKKAMDLNPDIKGDDIIPFAIEENVWTGIEELFMESPVTRDFVKKGFAKVVGAIYDVGTGKVSWLPEDKTFEILEKVEASPEKAVISDSEESSAQKNHEETSDQKKQEEPSEQESQEAPPAEDAQDKVTEDPAVSHT